MSDTRAIFFLAIKDVFKDKKIFGLVVFILAASYINLIFFNSILNGFTNTFQDQLIELMTSHITLEPKEGQKYIDGVNNIERKIELIPGILAVAPRLSSAGTASHKSKTINAQLTGIIPSKESSVTILADKVISGEFLSDGDTGQILLGNGLTEGATSEMGGGVSNLGSVSVGDRVTISYSNGVVKSYRVKGIIKTGFGFSDIGIYTTSKEMESVIGLKDQASTILVKTSDKSASNKFKLLIIEQNIDAVPKTWQENAGFIEQINSSFSMIISVTSVVSLLTAAMTVGIIIYINAVHKKRVIGILKAIGAKNSAILKMFLLESIIFGLFGIAFGAVLGNLMVQYFSANPLDLPFGLVRPDLKTGEAINAAVSLMLAVLVAGFYPAYAAAKTNIVKAIWGE
ncbi:ABC transporter permease [archaeon]|nr:MAG: ABC transporter permease [archaeon]